MRNICNNEFFVFFCEIELFENKEVFLEYVLFNYFVFFFSYFNNMYEYII